jgi:hypothetical protein
MDTSNSIHELNELCLNLISRETLEAGELRPALTPIGELARALTPASLSRAAACPYLFMQASVSGVHRNIDQNKAASKTSATMFTGPGSVSLIRKSLAFAWHVAHSKKGEAPLWLGVSRASLQALAECSLSNLLDLAEECPEWVRLRWVGKPWFWRDLCNAAITNDPDALRRIRLRGLQMIATEFRAAT